MPIFNPGEGGGFEGDDDPSLLRILGIGYQDTVFGDADFTLGPGDDLEIDGIGFQEESLGDGVIGNDPYQIIDGIHFIDENLGLGTLSQIDNHLDIYGLGYREENFGDGSLVSILPLSIPGEGFRDTNFGSGAVFNDTIPSCDCFGDDDDWTTECVPGCTSVEVVEV